MHDLDLCYLTATEALSLFRERDLSPVELLRALMARTEQVEPRINAFASRRFERALEEARAAEATYASSAPSPPALLAGLPVALKNEHLLIGDTTTMGSSLLQGVVDTHNAPVTQRLLDAGAVIHAKTNVPEFFSAIFTRTHAHGITRNPWNLNVTCGGSSGGSGASLAAGTSMLATGSDIGGSIRIPASLCGVVGLKPSYGRVPEGDGIYALNPFNHIGPMARSVSDCALMFNVLNGPDSVDHATVKPKLTVPLEFPPLRGLKIALSIDLGYFQVDAEVERNTQIVAETLRSLGATVERVAVNWDHRVKEAAKQALGFFMGRGVAKRIEHSRDKSNDYAVELADYGLNVTPADYLDSIETTAQMHQAFQPILDTHDALICPTLAITGLPAEGTVPSFEQMFDQAMTYPFNMLSRYPVLNVPSGRAANGVPTGIQIVGRSFDETTVLQIGSHLEEAIGWHRWRTLMDTA